MGLTDELRVKLTNATNFDLCMGLQYVIIRRDKSESTPVKTRPENLSTGEEFRVSSGMKLESATKSPHSSMFKARIREPEKPDIPFKVEPSLRDAVNAQRREHLSEDDELQRALELSRKTEEEQKRMRGELIPIEEEHTVMLESDTLMEPPTKEKLKFSFNRQKIDKRQLALLNKLTKEYKGLQQAAQIELGIPEFERISRVIPASFFPFSGETIVTSGYENSEKAQLVERAKKLGFSYSYHLTEGCFLVASSTANPKYAEAKKLRKATIVDRKYIDDCFAKKERLPVQRYLKE